MTILWVKYSTSAPEPVEFNKTYSVDSIILITIELLFSHKRIK